MKGVSLLALGWSLAWSSVATAQPQQSASTPPLSHPASGADSDAAAPANEPSSDVRSDDIIVTAQRRSDNIRNVPISITAVSGSSVANLTAGGEDIRALAGRVPNLNVESTSGRGCYGLGSGLDSSVIG